MSPQVILNAADDQPAAATAIIRCLCGSVTAKETARRNWWLDETWPTISGGSLSIVACFPWRRLVVPYTGSDRCDGRCGGYCDSAMAWRGWCGECVDRLDEEYGDNPSSFDELIEWSCFDEGCVRAWAEHSHTACDVDIRHVSQFESHLNGRGTQ